MEQEQFEAILNALLYAAIGTFNYLKYVAYGALVVLGLVALYQFVGLHLWLLIVVIPSIVIFVYDTCSVYQMLYYGDDDDGSDNDNDGR